MSKLILFFLCLFLIAVGVQFGRLETTVEKLQWLVDMIPIFSLGHITSKIEIRSKDE